LNARIALAEGKEEEGRRIVTELLERRRRTQPSGRSAGCIFRNPPEFKAGQLIEEAGLKGLRIGGAQVSEVHANYIIAGSGARAGDVAELIAKVREEVKRRSGIELELEVEVVGEE
jgi:UDP-N-acetylmuramate dehydrogenase